MHGYTVLAMHEADRNRFEADAATYDLVPVVRRVMSDQITPVLAYRRLVSPDARESASFLLESVEVGGAVGRHSIVGAGPMLEVSARRNDVSVTDHRTGSVTVSHCSNPLETLREIGGGRTVAPMPPSLESASLPGCTGGWFGYSGYDTVRYMEPGSLPFERAPADDRGLPDLQFGLYRRLLIFDHVDKQLYLIVHVAPSEHGGAAQAWEAGNAMLDDLSERVQRHSVPLPPGEVDGLLGDVPGDPGDSNLTRDQFEGIVDRCKEYIRAGDVFQVVPSQRFIRSTSADPFAIYRALRIVNPSPYMIYMQTPEVVLVASSPEILCRVSAGEVTNRPLAGTRRRGRTPDEDSKLAAELLADPKERSEHAMLVDLARNDIGRVCAADSVRVRRLMEVEHYSHVMHLSSTVTGTLSEGLDCWDALQQSLPVGTVSGAPKVRAMQIIDELEPTRRGPYAGGIGGVGFGGDMDIAIALRTMVIPNEVGSDGRWTVHMQAGAGIVLDSDPASEYEETVSKAAALGRAVELAERAFGAEPGQGVPVD
tara:strand:+ start:8396 stop:10012 length:1617 start_codon:yes stop_codon:yes gene_type:complete